ncbi:MAG: HAD family phosphatase [Comamonadaceae bacterium]|nr:HAD family phosphatase [Comamonadaceae bacterium]
MTRVQAVVFDMDGVLIDSEDLWKQVRVEFAARLARRWSDEDQAATMGCNTAGWSRIMVERLSLREHGLDEAAVAHMVIDRLREKYRRHLPARDGAAAAVRRLAARYPLALASGSPGAVGEYVLEAMGLAPLFAVCAWGDEVEHGKPAPDLYLLALARLGVAAQHAVGIEDSGNGVRSLHAAGMGIVAAPHPLYPLRPEVAALAAVCIGHFDELDAAVVEKAGFGWPESPIRSVPVDASRPERPAHAGTSDAAGRHRSR